MKIATMSAKGSLKPDFPVGRVVIYHHLSSGISEDATVIDFESDEKSGLTYKVRLHGDGRKVTCKGSELSNKIKGLLEIQPKLGQAEKPQTLQ